MDNKEELLDEMKEYARKRGFNVSWSEVRNEFSDRFQDLSRYSRRRTRTTFGHWLTRMRNPGDAE